MGTRCVRLALLLAVVLQYASADVHAPCDPTTKPKSKCPHGVINDVACEDFPFTKRNCKDSLKETYLSSGSTSDWVVIKQLECVAGGKWEATLVETGDSVDVSQADTVVCAAMDPASMSCKDQSVLTTPACTDSDIVNTEASCTEITISDDYLFCDSNKKLFYKSAAVPVWTEAEWAFNCNRKTGKWMEEGWEATKAELESGDKAICADDDPTEYPLPNCSKFESECGPLTACNKYLIGVAPGVPGGIASCPHTHPDLYYNKNFGRWTPVVENTLACTADNEWEQGWRETSELEADDVICASGDPNQLPEGTCPLLRTKCELEWETANECEKPTNPYKGPQCSGAKKLYFKRADSKAFMAVSSMKCGDGKGALKYTFGTEDLDEVLGAGDYLICATSNPDSDVCSYFKPPSDPKFDPVAPLKTFEDAGKSAECPPHHDYVTTNSTYVSLPSNGRAPTCGPKGEWMLGADISLGAKLGCKIAKCKKCDEPNRANIPLPGHSGTALDSTGDCFSRKCHGQSKMFAIRGEPEPANYFLFAGRVTCRADGTGWEYQRDDGEEKTLVEEIDCAQILDCLDPDAYVASLECPTGAAAIDGCENANPNPTASPKTLNCLNSGLKLFVQQERKAGEEIYWEEVKEGTFPTCDNSKGKWGVDLVDENETVYRGHGSTFICAPANPKPKSTTTTTTTTPAPLLPICELCSGLEFYRNCKECVNSTKLEDKSSGEKGPDDKCLLKPNEGASLLYNNFQTVSDYLQCVRSDGTWKTATGAHVTRIISQLKAKEEKWLTLSYLIVGGAFLAIGGMAIGCVVIYMRMRKQLSSKEKKKKERGVTKKYTSSNVVKTNTKTDGGSKESSKSKVSSSKMDDNFEDKTLKIY